MITVPSPQERRSNDRRHSFDRRKDRLAELFAWAVKEEVFIDLRRIIRRGEDDRRDGLLLN